jgi:putative tricarboxylic transport membrane protein
MKIHDSLIGLGFLILAIATFVSSQGFAPAPGQPVGPALFPTIISIVLAIASATLIVRSLKASGPRTWISASPDLLHPRVLMGFLLVPISVIFYLLASGSLGFIFCSVIILLALFLVFGVRWLTATSASVLVSLAIFFLFERLLAVPLPRGFLESIV